MFKIKWTQEAEDLYFDTVSYWITHNGSADYSLRIIRSVEAKEALLRQNPYIGSPVEGVIAEGVRRVLALREFSLFYRLRDDVIEIISFWSNRNDPQKLNL